MKLKLFRILLIALPAYGITISIATHIHNSMVYESQLYLFNMGGNFMTALVAIFFSGFGSVSESYSQIFFVMVTVIGNLMFWGSVACLVPILKHKMKYKMKEK